MAQISVISNHYFGLKCPDLLGPLGVWKSIYKSSLEEYTCILDFKKFPSIFQGKSVKEIDILLLMISFQLFEEQQFRPHHYLQVLHLFLVFHNPAVPLSLFHYSFLKHDTSSVKYSTYICDQRCKWNSWTVGYRYCISASAIRCQYGSVFCDPLISVQEKNNFVTDSS